ncbi:MAG: hypothetical protein PHT60_08975 [Acidiphilium sp.]|nr:hypothetical protein [Acidiphilium sp.]MDD4935893.1 hypothetical protein [Acidiphilium sp.]
MMSEQDTRRRAILVLGMHRSGTSALTRVMALCGADLPAHLMDPAADNNETGFWESQAVVDLHDAALLAMGSSWSDTSSLPQSWFDSAEAVGFQHRLADVLVAEYGDAPLFIVKDPRLCRLMKLWLPVLAAQSIAPRVVIPIRHPLEVAASLHRREGFDPARSLLLWLGHALAAERDSRGLTRCFVTYDQLMADWSRVVARIGTALDIDWPTRTDTEATAFAVAGFLTDRLRHHAIPDDGPSVMPEWVAGVYRELAAAAAGCEPPREAIDRIGARLAEAETHFGPVIGALETDLAAKSAALQHWIDAAVERYGIIEDLRAEIARVTSDAKPVGKNIFSRTLTALRRSRSH